jgi:AraC family transcriptional regulator of adaptative response/methylated-DNA-[protein]-cysteine methyltransferase
MVGQTTLFNNENDGEGMHESVKAVSVIIKKMTEDELNNSLLNIQYIYEETRFGKILIASTKKGICFLAFVDDKSKALIDLINYYPKAIIENASSIVFKTALDAIDGSSLNNTINLHVKGTEFQFLVWQRLLEIPKGKQISYSHIAKSINIPKAARAVGTAVGSNPIAYLIPCHRVVQSNGSLGGYMWGLTRKSNIIAWETKNTSKQSF